MARIRTIKPQFFTSITINALSLPARLTFIGLLTHLDDEGRAVDEPLLIKAAIWPLDEAMTARKIVDHLDEMVALGLLVRYQVDGRKYLASNTFHEHQNINRPQASKLPAPPENILSERSVNAHTPLIEHTPQEGKGKERKGKEKAIAAVERGGWVADAVNRWAEHIGIEKHGRMGKELAPAVEVYGEAAVLAAVTEFGKWRREKLADFGERIPGLPYFVANVRHYIPHNLLKAAS